MKKMDLIGQRFGRWTVIEKADFYRNKGKKVVWRCKCECGNEGYVTTDKLRDGRSQSCGCRIKDRAKETHFKHGDSNSRLYNIWTHMKSRCYRKSDAAYLNYGGRGITVCEEWISDYDNFKNWALSNGYVDTLTIDRIDVNGNYTPENCRWATPKEQACNRRNNVYLEVDGEKHLLTEWSKIVGISVSTISQRLRLGWSDEKAIMTGVEL